VKNDGEKVIGGCMLGSSLCEIVTKNTAVALRTNIQCDYASKRFQLRSERCL